MHTDTRRKKNVIIYQRSIVFVLGVIDQELHLLQDRLDNPAYFAAEKSCKSLLYLVPKFKPLNLMELIASIYELQILQGIDNQPAKFIQIVQAFEWLFNFSFNGRERRIKSELYDRKRGETKFLDDLRNQLLSMNTNQMYSQSNKNK